ncbi:putative phage tail protein, partial [Acidaminococcus provencensis]|uniref:putative phage tail protein n=1 Tax=Acidaminococcus provencensis TaxID=2058289 RepID=UPI0022E3DB93
MPNFKLLRDSEPDVSRYLPLFLCSDPTFKSWLDTQSEEHKRLWMDIIDAWKQFYVEEATWGLSDWEKFLGIPTDEKLSYTVRRSAIIAKMNGTQTVTKAFLERTINSFT